MSISKIKYLYHRYINEKNRTVLRWIILLGITTYLIISAAPHVGPVERSRLWNIIFWSVNGLFLLFITINMIGSIYAAIRIRTKEYFGNAVCSIVIAVILVLYVMDMYTNNVFYSIKHAIVNFLT